MPQLPTLKINEIFWSFQGEGKRAGYPTIFLRLSGCSYRCSYCDTRDSWENGTVLPVDEIIGQIDGYRNRYPQSQVVLTGGEPLEQDLAPLTAALKQKGYFLAIETNGGCYRELPIDWWAVSPKDVSGYYLHPDLIPHIHEIKLVVNSHLTPDVVRHIRSLVPGVPVLLQPEGADEERYARTFSLFQLCQEKGIENIWAGAQLHQVYRVR
ncbi:MAG: 7-carboxy-7-deazaguanine synthase QueE [Candidatus Omnitrophota bacterium]